MRKALRRLNWRQPLRAFKGQKSAARFFWKRLDDDDWNANKSLLMELNPDGQFHVYRLDLRRSPKYRGLIIGLALQPAKEPHPGEELTIRSIVLSGAKEGAGGPASVTSITSITEKESRALAQK